jgi:hypothetical protein
MRGEAWGSERGGREGGRAGETETETETRRADSSEAYLSLAQGTRCRGGARKCVLPPGPTALPLLGWALDAARSLA